MSEWGMLLWAAIILAVGAGMVALEMSGWQPNGYAASTHDDPSPGPNALF